MEDNIKAAVKNHPDMIHYRKVFKTESIIFAVIIVGSIFLLPPVAFFAAVVYVVILLIYLIGGALSRNKIKNEILSVGKETAYAKSRESRKVRQKTGNVQRIRSPQSTDINEIQDVLNNPAVEVAASYALGKAVTKPAKPVSKEYRCDPYHGGKNCASCEYWTGKRTTEKRTAGARNMVVICSSKSVSGSCKKPGSRYFNRIRHCTDCCIDGWAAWSALK